MGVDVLCYYNKPLFCFPLLCISLTHRQASLTVSPAQLLKFTFTFVMGTFLNLWWLFTGCVLHWWHDHYLFTLIFLVNVTSEVQHRGLVMPWLNQFIKISRESHPPVHTSQMFCFHLIRQLIWPSVPQEWKDALTIYLYMKGWQGNGTGHV